jgi:parvulin-like peptidyl-prolyl isomerase
MKKIKTVWIIGLLSIVLAGASCSREKAADKPAVPPGHQKMVEEYKKGIDKSKSITIAKVNGVDITMNDLINKMNQIAPKYMKDVRQRTPEIDKKVKEEALDTLVFMELAIQKAGRLGMKADPRAVDERVKNLKARLRTEEAYRTFLERTRQTEESVRKQAERDTVFEMIAGKEIFQKIRLDDKLVRDTYNKDKKSYIVPEEIDVEEVVFPGVKDSAAAMDKANETLALIKKNNSDFSKLAQDKSYMVRKGTITGREYPNIARAAAVMQEGGLSAVIAEDDGLHIIKLLKRQPSRQMAFEEAKGPIEQKLMLPLVTKRKQEWEAELKKAAKIEILLPEVEKKLREEAQKKG